MACESNDRLKKVFRILQILLEPSQKQGYPDHVHLEVATQSDIAKIIDPDAKFDSKGFDRSFRKNFDYIQNDTDFRLIWKTEENNQRLYGIDPNSRQPAFSVSTQENEVLVLALNWALNTVLHAEAQQALLKLSAIGVVNPATPSHTYFVPEQNIDYHSITTVLKAIHAHRPIDFFYFPSPVADHQERHLLPLQILSRQGRLFLHGIDMDSATAKTFRLSRIQDIDILNQKPSQHVLDAVSEDTLRASTDGFDRTLHDVELILRDPSQMTLFDSLPQVTMAKDTSDGSKTIRLASASRNWLWNLLTGHPDTIVLESHPELHQEIQNYLEDMKKIFSQQLEDAQAQPQETPDLAPAGEKPRKKRDDTNAQVRRTAAILPFHLAYPARSLDVFDGILGLPAGTVAMEIADLTEYLNSELLTQGKSIAITKPPIFNELEASVLVLALEAIMQIDPTRWTAPGESLRQKLLPFVYGNHPEADTARRSESRPESSVTHSDRTVQKRQVFEEAITSQRLVQASYTSTNRTSYSDATFQIASLVHYDQTFYVLAKEISELLKDTSPVDLPDSDVRSSTLKQLYAQRFNFMRVDGFTDVKLTEYSAPRRIQIELDPSDVFGFLDDKNVSKVLMRVPGRASWLREYTQMWDFEDRGEDYVVMPYAGPTLESIILSHGHYLEDINSVKLLEEVLKKTEEGLENYRT